MASGSSATADEILFSRRLAGGEGVEVHEIAGEIVIRLFDRQERHFASHLSHNREQAVEAAMQWNGADYPFAE